MIFQLIQYDSLIKVRAAFSAYSLDKFIYYFFVTLVDSSP
jgi:hypothetical protein